MGINESSSGLIVVAEGMRSEGGGIEVQIICLPTRLRYVRFWHSFAANPKTRVNATNYK